MGHKRMIITDYGYSSRGNGENHVRYYFYDLDRRQSLGPVGFLWRDFFISRSNLNSRETDDIRDLMQEHGLDKVSLEAIPDTQHKFVVHLRGVNEKQLKRLNLKDKFVKQSPSEMTQIRWDFTRTQVRGLEEVLAKQKQVHRLFRELHDDVRFPMRMDGEPTRKITTAVKKTGQFQRITELHQEIEQELKGLDPANRTSLNIRKGQLLILLNSSKGIRREIDDQLPEKILEMMLGDRGFVVDDIELGDYPIPGQEKIYLDWYCWKENRRFAGQGFGYSPIEDPEFEKAVSYDSSAQDQHWVRRNSARFFFDFDPLGQGGHNNLSFDNQKRLNPHRKAEVAQKRAKGDSVFLCRPDNSELVYSRDKAISEIIKGPGIVTDTFRFCSIHFAELFPNTKLETIIEFFKHFVPDFEFTFKKSLQSYLLIEEKRKRWEQGDPADGQDITEYGYWDVVAHLVANLEMLPMIVNIADCTGTDIFSAGIYYPKNYGQRFWNEHYFNERKKTKFWQFAYDNSYGSFNNDSIAELAASTNIWSSKKNKIRDAKKRVTEKVLADMGISINRRKGLHENVSVFHIPSFALGMEWYFRYFRDEKFRRLCRLYDDMTDAKSPLEAMAYGNVLDGIAHVPLFEAKQVLRGDQKPFFFERDYRFPVRKMMQNFQKALEKRLEVLKGKNLVAYTGDLLLIEDLEEEEIQEIKRNLAYFGQADAVHVKEMAKRRAPGDRDEVLVMDFAGLMSSRGMKMPTEKTVLNAGYGDRKSVAETRTLFNFVKQVFEDRRKGLEYLAEVGRELRDYDPLDFVCTQKLRKDIDEYVWKDGRPQLKRLRILNALGAKEKDESRSYAVGRMDEDAEDNFVEFRLEEKEYFQENFRPRVGYYQRLLFGEGSPIFRIASSLFFPDTEDHGSYEAKRQAYDNIISGNMGMFDIDILLAPIEKDIEEDNLE